MTKDKSQGDGLAEKCQNSQESWSDLTTTSVSTSSAMCRDWTDRATDMVLEDVTEM